MTTELNHQNNAPPKSWMTRWFARKGSPSTPHLSAKERGSSSAPQPDLADDPLADVTQTLIAQNRYAFVLLKAAETQIDDDDAARAWDALEADMALVPGGRVPVVQGNGTIHPTEVPAFYLDRQPVSNRQFLRFVQAGCYDMLEIWPAEVWPSLLRFTDRTGQPGPAGWEHGSFPRGQTDHPVVGICWYEALAYARWVGKRLATATEWQKAGGWPEHLSGGSCNRYPWGDLFDPARANVWATGLGKTAPVTAFPSGNTPNGIRQMTGNVWEWLDDPLDAVPCQPGETFRAWRSMRRIIGGAYDTYLASEATCHFVTGQSDLDRRENLGFRCAVAVDHLRFHP